MTDAYVAFGSNLGNRQRNFHGVLDLIAQEKSCRILRRSHLFETAPVVVDKKVQSAYLNACIAVKTTLSCMDFFALLKQIETCLGRQRGTKWAARTVDLDLLMFADQVLWDNSIHVPHPRMSFRQFVLNPLRQIAPHVIHPICGISVSQLVQCINSPENRILVRSSQPIENLVRTAGALARMDRPVLVRSPSKFDLFVSHRGIGRADAWSVEFTDWSEQQPVEPTPVEPMPAEPAPAKLTVDIINEMTLAIFQRLHTRAILGPHLLIDDGPISESLAWELCAAIDAMTEM
jgi:2-amino-4-hydroxy-6-hydroxymethyldihydropteridine diphosphokinase